MANPLKKRFHSHSFCCIGVSSSIAATLLILGPDVHAQGDEGTSTKPIVLVAPFENQSKQHENIQYEVGTGSDPNKPKRRFTVDRYTEAPRTLLENTLSNIEGVTIVERQRVDSLLLEGEFGRSGLVDSEKAIKLGKMLGANLIAIGTIADLRDEKTKFTGYGIKNESMTVNCQIRFRLLEIETGKIVFSKIVKGSKTYTKSSYGETKSSDRNFAAIEVVMDKLAEDSLFRTAVLGKKREAAASEGGGGLIEVEFSPKPDNCDIEIDGKYLGGSPLKRRLISGKDYTIRISKDGYKEWKGVIAPEAGLRITRELSPDR